MKISEIQMLALRCACADLIGSLQARNQNDVELHDWNAHSQTINDLINAFDFLSEFSNKAEEADGAFQEMFGEFVS